MNKWFNYFIWLLVIILYLPVFKELYGVRWDTVDYTHAKRFVNELSQVLPQEQAGYILGEK